MSDVQANVFMVVAILNPTPKESEDSGILPKIVMGPKAVVAKSNQAAAIQVTLHSEELRQYDESRLEVLVSPF